MMSGESDPMQVLDEYVRPFTDNEYRERLARTRRRMDSAGVDALLVTGPTNINYLTGYDGYSFYVHQFALVVPDLVHPLWIGRQQDVNGARVTTWLPEEAIHHFPDAWVQSHKGHPADKLVEVLKQHGLERATIGAATDDFYMTGRTLDILRGSLPHARIEDTGVLVNWVRTVKSQQEIAYMREASRLTELAMQAALDTIEPGVRQCDVIAEVLHAQTRGTVRFGGDYPAIMPLMPSGRYTNCPHLTWRDTPLGMDTSVTVELSGVRFHYHSPLTRTFYLGEPDAEIRRMADIVLEGIDAAAAATRPGALARDVHAAWTGVIDSHGIHKDSRCGYGTGLGYPPDWGEQTVSLRADDETVLEPHMTIHFMPGLWLADRGIAISEMFHVTEDGVEMLCEFPRQLVCKA